MENTETLKRWEAIEGIDFAFISAEIHSDYPKLYVRLIDGRVEAKQHHDLVLSFSNVVAFTMHEEFVHPTQQTTWGREPIISLSKKATFPCLIIENSPWYKGLKFELELNYPNCVHYRLCTCYPVIDIVSPEPPIVNWSIREADGEGFVLPKWVKKLDAH